jgi:hypothetical protein
MPCEASLACRILQYAFNFREKQAEEINSETTDR